MKKSRKFIVLALMMMLLCGLTACVKPYDTPEFVTIEASQTAFLIPLVGDTSDQASFASEELLEQAKVATKEIQIPHRWVQTGRQSWIGEYRDSATLIVVERKPVSRSWNSGDSPETSGNAIWGGTKDGVGIYVGMSCSAQINEADATKFLYRFNNTPLENIIDNEIKTMVREEFNNETRKYTSTELNANKSNIMEAVKESVKTYFKEYGITITVLGTNEDFSYENAAIQKAIDDKFISEQALITQQNENAVALAKAKAEADAVLMKKEAEAEALKIEANAQAEAVKIAANAEAEANRKIAESLTPELLDLKKIEEYMKAWNGSVPVIQGSDSTNFMDITSILNK